jgi:hypothetical protein
MVFTAASSCYNFGGPKSWFGLSQEESQFAKGRTVVVSEGK